MSVSRIHLRLHLKEKILKKLVKYRYLKFSQPQTKLFLNLRKLDKRGSGKHLPYEKSVIISKQFPK